MHREDSRKALEAGGKLRRRSFKGRIEAIETDKSSRLISLAMLISSNISESRTSLDTSRPIIMMYVQ